MKNLLSKVKSRNWGVVLLNLCAVAAVLQNVNLACAWVHHQPKVPDAAMKFKKF